MQRLRPATSAIFRQQSAAAVSRSIHTSASASRVYESILDTVGQTPVVKLNNIPVENDCKVYVKCEYFNPLSSVKDRLALAAINDAEKKGLLKPGQTVVEATSGNTGIALAMVCAAKGYPLVITMAETFSVERRRVMRMLGAKVVITPGALRGSGMVAKAKELAATHGWYWTRQFENDANWEFHAQTTGAEIVSDFAGRRLDYWVSGYGTGGTVHGAGKTIKAGRPSVQIVLSEPTTAALVSSGKKQERNPDGTAPKSHAAFTPHPIQGWTPDFIPLILEKGLDKGIVDKVVQVGGDDALATSRLLAAKEGIFCGVSGGATVRSALDLAKTAPKGSVILAMIPDTAERYLSTPLFASFPPEMNEDELKISKSTPTAQMP